MAYPRVSQRLLSATQNHSVATRRVAPVSRGYCFEMLNLKSLVIPQSQAGTIVPTRNILVSTTRNVGTLETAYRLNFNII